jgi:hypothetical protein
LVAGTTTRLTRPGCRSRGSYQGWQGSTPSETSAIGGFPARFLYQARAHIYSFRKVDEIKWLIVEAAIRRR